MTAPLRVDRFSYEPLGAVNTGPAKVRSLSVSASGSLVAVCCEGEPRVTLYATERASPLLHLEDERIAVVPLQFKRVVYVGQLAVEMDVDHGSDDLLDFSVLGHIFRRCNVFFSTWRKGKYGLGIKKQGGKKSTPSEARGRWYHPCRGGAWEAG